jgi:hypothetical protein
MQAILAIRNLLHQAKPVLLAHSNAIEVQDRVTLALMRARSEQIEAARRYWACPF